MAKSMKWRLGFGNGVLVDRVDLGGGLALYRKDEVDVSLCSFSNHHIDVTVYETNCNWRWRFNIVHILLKRHQSSRFCCVFAKLSCFEKKKKDSINIKAL